MKELVNGSITSPKGYQAAGVAAGIKSSGVLDVALIYSEVPAQFVCAFTNNSFAAASVLYCKEVCTQANHVRAIAINSGNANSCTGKQGEGDAMIMAEITSECLEVEPHKVFVSSTGRIGVPLPMTKIKQGIQSASSRLSSNGGIDAATAILTTDKVPKAFAVEIDINGVPVTIGGIAKGAGMLFPRLSVEPHATMLAYITTDGVIEQDCFYQSLERTLDKSFNCISVDGDTSTNDTVIALANGQAENPTIRNGSAEAACFHRAFEYVAAELARMMVVDGEGATKFVELVVTGAKTIQEARKCAECIANSLLCKTAWFGADPNWGRILDAAGYSGVTLETNKVNLRYDDVVVVSNGLDSGSSLQEREAVLKQREFKIVLDLGVGDQQFVFWTCDLSYDYVKINADYRT